MWLGRLVAGQFRPGRVLNAAARVITGTRKFDRGLGQILHDQLHRQWQFTSVWTAAHHRISRSTASQSPVLTRAGICVPPTVIYLPYRVSGSTLTAVGRSRLLARWLGTHSRILSGIQRAAQTVLGLYLKRTCSCVTSASSALKVLNDYALYKSTHSLTHSLIVHFSSRTSSMNIPFGMYTCSELRGVQFSSAHIIDRKSRFY